MKLLDGSVLDFYPAHGEVRLYHEDLGEDYVTLIGFARVIVDQGVLGGDAVTALDAVIFDLDGKVAALESYVRNELVDGYEYEIGLEKWA